MITHMRMLAVGTCQRAAFSVTFAVARAGAVANHGHVDYVCCVPLSYRCREGVYVTAVQLAV